ncbi:MAG: bifunctional riboflavin kinase/FMN adenylyltransferase, partial [Lachnospiraceae bacterium]|nr:bifunctional riboflavin kinase/FMN adenylyltransferase [Lachnospiraceae bacterium]
MKIIANTTDFYLKEKTAVAIGKFDGVHVGHRRLLEEILQQKSKGFSTCVFTFEPAPAVLFGYSDGMELTTREEKRLLFEKMGVDILIEFPLNKQTAAMPPEEFITQFLVKRMNSGFVAAGKDLSFGDKGAGNARLLQQLGTKYGYQVQIIDKVIKHGVEISSSYIREQVEAGEMKLAEEL